MGAGVAETASSGRLPLSPPSFCERRARLAPTSAPRVTIAQGWANHGAQGGSNRRPRRERADRLAVTGAELAGEVKRAHPVEGEVTLLGFRPADYVSAPKATAAGAAPAAPLAINLRCQSTELRRGWWVGGWVWGSYVVPTRFIYFSSVKLYLHPLWSFCRPYLHPTLHTLSLPAAPPLPTSERHRESKINCIFFFLMTTDEKERSTYR